MEPTPCCRSALFRVDVGGSESGLTPPRGTASRDGTAGATLAAIKGSGERRGRIAIATGLPLAIALAIAVQALAATHIPKPAAGDVKLGVDAAERAISLQNGLPVDQTKQNALANPTVVYSLAADQLSTPEHARINATVYTNYCISTDVADPNSPCSTLQNNGGPSQYTINLQVLVYKASAENAQPGTLLDSTPSTFTCTNNGHHCPVRVELDLPSLSSAGNQFINAAIIAWAPAGANWQSNDLMELAGDCLNGSLVNCSGSVPTCQPPPDDDICQTESTKGQLSVLRIGEPYATMADNTATDAAQFVRNQISVDTQASPASPEVVHSTEVNNLQPGDVIEVDGRMDADPVQYANGPPDANYQFKNALETRWILSTSANATAPLNSVDRWAAPRNSKNCLNGHCEPRQIGAVTAPPNAPPTMYLNFVAYAKDQHTQVGFSPKVELSNGNFDVKCYPEPRSPAGPLCSF
jgi:hypothetical protein